MSSMEHTTSGPTQLAQPVATIGIPSACTEVLQNEDVIMIILDMFRKSVEEPTTVSRKVRGKGRFVPLLLVNRCLFHSTIGFVWETMESFLPLFSLLPSFKVDDTGYSFVGIQPAEWSRFGLYAKRVKHFTFERECVFQHLDRHWFGFLLNTSSRTPFFPSLQSISSTCRAIGGLWILPIATSPQLQSLRVETAEGHNDDYDLPSSWGQGDLINHLEGLITNWAYFARDLKVFEYLGPLTLDLTRSLCQMNQLTYLTLTPTSMNHIEVIGAITQLSCLRHLKLVALLGFSQFGNYSSAAIEKKLKEPAVLPNLVTLNIVASMWDSSLLLSCFPVEKLESLEVQVTDSASLTSTLPLYYRLLAAIIIRNQNLHQLTLTNARELPVLPSPWSPLMKEAQTSFLMAISRGIQNSSLTALEITGIPCFTGSMLPDAIGECLTASLASNITTFCLHCPPHLRVQNNGDSDSFATLNTLKHLAFQGCETLRHLELQFNEASLQRDMPDLPTSRPSKHGLLTLGIMTDSTNLRFGWEHNLRIAMLLSRLFPSLNEVWGADMVACHQINVMVKAFKGYRRTITSEVESPFAISPVSNIAQGVQTDE